MPLSPRKEKIIKAVVDSYIRNPAPVSSKEIQASHLRDTSSATIRNELAALEEMGYLEQPHTSSGRVPTAEAYKLYVEKLMPARKLTRAELAIIEKHFNSQLVEIEDILKKTVKVISEITNYTSVAFAPKIGGAIVKNIKIVKVTENTALVVIVTDLGIIKDTLIEVGEDFSEAYFEAAARFVLKSFYNHTVAEILNPDSLIRDSVDEYRKFFDGVLKILREYFLSEGEGIILEGGSKILEYPEYSDVHRAREVLQIFDAKDRLYPMLKEAGRVDLNIKIGPDTREDALSDCAIVTANYQVHGKSVGNAGVIGPIRMDYPLVVSVLDYIGKVLKGLPEKLD
ncbi:heat-inducible transcription repressor HrcA [Clostridia bacterium]|nr:heat-inducible transcription repressor HrcA [Clostridia bacterium]